MTKSEVINILKTYKAEKAQQYGIDKLGIFGSFARDTYDEQSDVDIVVETSVVDMFVLVHVKEELEERIKRTVDIVRNRRNLNPSLKRRIENEAIYV